MGQEVRVRRSEMTTPASSARMIEKAANSQADVVILDLEDATAQGEKETARKVLVEAALEADWGDRTLAFRPNAMGSRWFEKDMQEVVVALGDRLDCVVVPKVDSAKQVQEVDALLLRLENEAGLEAGRVGLEVLIETPQAVLDLEQIARASARLEAFIFGVADYAACIGARLGPDVFTDYAYVKQRIVTVARAYDIHPIDCVTFRYQDLEQTRRDAEAAARMGFEGKWCVHPAQVEVVNQAFTPNERAVEWAQAIVSGFHQAQEQGRGALAVGSEMVDMATVRVAQGILEKKRVSQTRG
jgi:citrate lyase beta subunit